MQVQDELNPAMMFNMTYTELLVRAAKGELDLQYYARLQLAQRGLDQNGAWVGFKEAEKIHNV